MRNSREVTEVNGAEDDVNDEIVTEIILAQAAIREGNDTTPAAVY